MAKRLKRSPRRASNGSIMPDGDQAAEDAAQSADGANANGQDLSDGSIKLKLSDVDDGPDETVERTDDGGAIIRKKDDVNGAAATKKHFANLAADLNLKDKLASLAQSLWQEIEVDIQGATKAVQKYAEAMGSTGQTGKAPGGAAFSGASEVTHPIMGEVAADYTARVLREMLPPKGPAKPYVEGTVTKDKFDRAKRVSRFMNWQTRKIIKNFAAEMEQGFAQQPFSGASYMKIWREGKKPKIAFVPYEKVHRPANADDFYSCERITHELDLSKRSLLASMKKGLYIHHDFGSGVDPDQNKAQQVADKVTGTVDPPENVDKTRPFYEVSCFWDGENDAGDMRPYLVTFDRETKVVISCYRNWEKGDEDCERLDFLYEFGFWPFRDGKPIGLATMLSGLPRAATGALRALLDSALANNFPGANKIKGGQSGSTNMPDPGTINEIENATQVDDIRKLMMQVELNAPSPVLFQLLGFLVDAARGVVRTTFDDIVGKGRQDIPVGTMMMLVDEGTVVYSSIFGRQHRAMTRMLGGLYRLNRRIVDNASFEDGDGEDRVTRRDFEGDSVVEPVSDPRINSDTQRWARTNFVAGRAADPANQGLYNRYEAEKALLEAAQIENIEVILNKPQAPTEMSAVNENVAAALGKAITAFPEQNHFAHLENHADFIKSPLFGAAKAFQPALVPAMSQHFKEHMVMAYASESLKLVDAAIHDTLKDKPGKTKFVDELKEGLTNATTEEGKLSIIDMMRLKDPELGKSIDKIFAAASRMVLMKLQQILGPSILPMLEQLDQLAQTFKPPPPMDPTQAAIQTATLGAKATTDVAGIRAQSDAQKQDKQLQHDSEQAAQDRAAETRAADQKDVIAATAVRQKGLDTEVRHEMNIEDNVTATTIAQAELLAGHKSNVSTGTGVNPGSR